MAIPKQIPRQRDFSGGQLDEHAKRGDDLPIVRAGARQARNFRIVNTRTLEERPSRSLLFPDGPRVDEVRINSEITVRLCFSDGELRVRGSAGVINAARAGMPWTDDTVKDIRWTLAQNDIVIFYPGMRPVVVHRVSGDDYTIYNFDFSDGADGNPRAPFMRVPITKGIRVTPSGATSNIDLEFDADVLEDAHVGALFRIANKKVEITAVSDAQNATATCLERLLPQNKLTLDTVADSNGFSVGQVVIGDSSDAEGEILEIDTTNGFLYVQLLNYHGGFTNTEDIVGPNQKSTLTAAAQVAAGSFKPTLVWDEQIISDARGWPQSGSSDRNRLILCDIPGVPEAILESAIDASFDFEIDGTPDGAIGEFMAGKPRVYNVVGGPDQFVFTDQGTFYIPISESNPLKSGSVTFRPIPSDVVPAVVQPAEADEGIVFLNAELTRVLAVIPTGQTATPYLIEDLNEWHADLLSEPIAITVTKGAGAYPERYLIVVNSDGTLAVGKRRGKDMVGWVPWDGEGFVTWCSAKVSDVIVTSTYTFGGVDRSFAEAFDPDVYVDAAVLLNDIPAPLAGGDNEDDVEIYGPASETLGDMTSGAGLAAPFVSDGVALAAASARAIATSGYDGLVLAHAHTISKVTVWPSSDNGYVTGSANITIDLYGSQSAPVSGTNGTLLGTSTVTDITSGSTTVSNTVHPHIEYSYVWVYIHDSTATNVYAGSIRFYTAGQQNETASGGTGDLWFMAGETVDLVDGYRVIGERAVDADGVLVEGEGDDLTSDTLAVGKKWDATFEPIIPHAESGASVKQTTRKRKLTLFVTVQSATGFVCGNRRIATFRQGEDQAEAPTLRETTYKFRKLGRAYDPRIELTKDSPGPLRILESAPEVTV